MEKIKRNSLIPLELSPEFKGIKKEDIKRIANDCERKSQLAEERRLCYVAFTRAKKKLILTYAKRYGERPFLPSQFLNEIHYKEDKEITFLQDKEEKYTQPKTNTPKDISMLLRKENFENNLIKEAIRENSTEKKLVFSKSSLLLFLNCQKKFEYKYIYNMPEEEPPNWEAIKLGNFVHIILEKGVKLFLSSEKQFTDLAAEMRMKDEWEGINIEDALRLIRVFYARNKAKYSKESRTEQNLQIEMEGIKFKGFADRIDFNQDGLEIIDYKTGASAISPRERNWQLGLYAMAASKNFGRVKKVTLDLLRQEKSLEFEIDEKGNATAIHSRKMEFNIQKVKKEIIETAKQILLAQKNGFKSCQIEKNCDFCREFAYDDR